MTLVNEKWLRRVALTCVAASTVLVAMHAYRDRRNSFPDENLHIVNASYYVDHWLPPAIGPELAPYAGVHGVSYHMLWPPQAAYWLYAKAGSWVTPDSRWRFYRGLSVALWATLAIYLAACARKNRWLFVLVGLTPAVWYVFAYYCPDAFSFAVCALLVAQLTRADSMSRRFLQLGSPKLGAVVLGAGVGLLALTKLNYLPFSATLFVYCVNLLWRNRSLTGFASRAAIATAIAISVAAPLLVADLARNADRRNERYDAAQETFAGPGFHASDVRNGTAYYGYKLRERGVSAGALFHRPWDWGRLTYRSFFGIYGAMDVNPLPRLNDLQAFLAVALVALFCFTRRRSNRILLYASVASSIMTVAASFWRTWAFDFQAQGRYCFALIPIFTLLATDDGDDRQPVLFWGLASTLGVAGLISLAMALPYLG